MGGGLLLHRLTYAHVGGLVVLVAGGLALRSKGRTRVGAALLALVGLYAIAAFPFARGALVALTLAGLVMVVLGSPRRGVAGAAGLVLLLAVSGYVGASPELRERFMAGFRSEGNSDRVALWSTGWQALSAHPWVGVGLGRFHPRDYAPAGVEVHPSGGVVKAHNQLLTLAAELGVPGVLLFLVLLAWIALRVRARKPEGVACLGALAFFLFLSAVHDPLFHAPFSMALVLVLGLGLGRGSSMATTL
jgi:O-antigen ligase